MSFVAAPGVVSLDAIWLLDNQRVENTFNYHVTGTIDHAKLKSIADAYFAWVNTNVALWPTNAECIQCYARDLSSQFGAVYSAAPVSPLVGTKVGTALPNNVSFAVKRGTGLSGRKNRGRLYWIGVTDTDRADDNHVASSRANSWVTALNTLLSSQATTNAAAEVILHRNLGTYQLVTEYTYSDRTMDAMRRRLPDHNRHH